MSDVQAGTTNSGFRKAFLWIYPFLLGYYPVFALRNHNIIYVDLPSILRTLLLVTAGTTVVWLIAYLFIRHLEKASIIVSLVVLSFLSYGHLYSWLEDVLGTAIRHRYLVGLILLVLVGVAFLVLRREPVARVMAQFLMTISVVLLAIVLSESVQYDLKVSRASSAAAQELPGNSQASDAGQLPDFYLIILDAHTRSDVLAQRFGYDNSPVIQQLTDMGFYVSSCSQSNYASTKLSLTSALFADYIENIAPDEGVLPPLKDGAINRTLEALGYQTIAFENRAHGHFDLKEDVTLSRNEMAFGKVDLRGGLSEFETMMIDTSFMRFVVDTELIPGFDQDTLQEWELWEHYYQTLFILDELAKLPDTPGPKFVFAHLMVPHTPFIFASDGSFKRNTNPIEGYAANTEFIDTRLPSLLKTIIDRSDQPPVIIVMGDHGPSTRKTITKEMRMATFNAYYVDEEARTRMYPTMTPINAFRIILNAHFGEDLPLLEDKSIYAYKQEQLEDAESISSDCQPSP